MHIAEGYKSVIRFLEGVRDMHNMPESPVAEMVDSARKFGRSATIGTYVAVGCISLATFWPATILPVAIFIYTNGRSYMRNRERERRYQEIGEY